MINSYQQQYYDITKRIMKEPHKVGSSRIGDMNSRFCEQMRINLKEEFPIMDIKWIKFSNVVHELIWMLRGDTNIKYLIENNCHIWTDDAYRYYKEKYDPERGNPDPQLDLFPEEKKKEFIKKILDGEDMPGTMSGRYGDMDNIYGYQWRKFGGYIDQVQDVLDMLQKNPDDRRMIITGHNPKDLAFKNVGLPSCHNYMQFYTTINGDSRDLNTFCNIRSNDWFLGQPYNVVQYALITHIFAKMSGMGVGELVINAVDAHLYHAHFDVATIWLKRFEELPYSEMVKDEENTYRKNTFCRAKLADFPYKPYIGDYNADDFKLIGYDPMPYIKAKLLT